MTMDRLIGMYILSPKKKKAAFLGAALAYFFIDSLVILPINLACRRPKRVLVLQENHKKNSDNKDYKAGSCHFLESHFSNLFRYSVSKITRRDINARLE